jgi:hypothetical protein
MELEQAKQLLKSTVRQELRDHAFGDVEISWMVGAEQLASGYFSGTSQLVSIMGTSFDGDDARALRDCGIEGVIERNDETGPEEYTEGDVMPGLSKGDVFQELTGSYLDES